MENYGVTNVLAVITGISIFSTCCLISLGFQKKFFNKYRDKVRNEVDKARSQPAVISNKKI